MEWTVTEAGRLDAFLAQQPEILSRTQGKRLIEEKQIQVNDQTVSKPAHQLEIDDRVVIDDDVLADAQVQESAGTITPVDLSLEILYEDDACLVINKPAGIAVHPGHSMPEGEVTLLHGLLHWFEGQALPFSVSTTLVHRLDKDTTGCLLVAKTPAAHAALQVQFKDRTVKKTYLALVTEIPNPPEAMIDAPIGRHLQDRTKMTILQSGSSREAQTTYRTLKTGDDCALVECDLHTGRTHQIRVHLASIGCPILGDEKYGGKPHESLCLHAQKLQFVSPVDQEVKTVEAPKSQSFIAAEC